MTRSNCLVYVCKKMSTDTDSIHQVFILFLKFWKLAISWFGILISARLHSIFIFESEEMGRHTNSQNFCHYLDISVNLISLKLKILSYPLSNWQLLNMQAVFSRGI